MNERTDVKKLKLEEGLTENIGLPLTLLEKHSPWPAYVNHTSPVVQKLIEKSQARERECRRMVEEHLQASRPSRPSGIYQLKRRKSSKTSGEMVLKEVLSEATSSVWGACSISALGPPLCTGSMHLQMDSRECPTANYNKIIFSRKPMMRIT